VLGVGTNSEIAERGRLFWSRAVVAWARLGRFVGGACAYSRVEARAWAALEKRGYVVRLNSLVRLIFFGCCIVFDVDRFPRGSSAVVESPARVGVWSCKVSPRTGFSFIFALDAFQRRKMAVLPTVSLGKTRDRPEA
jgi:hypothetical protein